VGHGSGVSRGGRNRNARLARLRLLVPVTNATVGILPLTLIGQPDRHIDRDHANFGQLGRRSHQPGQVHREHPGPEQPIAIQHDPSPAGTTSINPQYRHPPSLPAPRQPAVARISTRRGRGRPRLRGMVARTRASRLERAKGPHLSTGRPGGIGVCRQAARVGARSARFAAPGSVGLDRRVAESRWFGVVGRGLFGLGVGRWRGG